MEENISSTMSPLGADAGFNATSFLHQQEEFFIYDNESQERLLAAEPAVIDFTVLAMAVVTLSLLLIVGVLRHLIDKYAKGKEFFENVLEAVYHELSTLGIVEAVIFLVHHYYADLNIKVEKVFANVHFTLFFVAIINAIMSCLLYFFAIHIAEKQWDKLETIDLDHYVAVRKEFEAISKHMNAIKNVKKNAKKDNRGENEDGGQSFEYETSGETGIFLKLIRSSPYSILQANMRQVLDMKYKKLLVQVRFHELRVHFIERYSLDPKFRVSSYLRLCMTDVFTKLVHITTFSWLILLASTNLLFFITGVITTQTKDEDSIPVTLSWVYIGYTVMFVLVSVAVSLKMKNIFFVIMKNEEWIKKNGKAQDEDIKSEHNFEDRRSSVFGGLMNDPSSHDQGDSIGQKNYFWGGEPEYIVYLCQFMQFGYALAFGILLVFNNTVLSKETPLKWVGLYVLAPSICYLLFVWIWAFIIPQFTQCTSLGELVNQQHLNDLKASFELNEARLHRQDELDYIEVNDNLSRSQTLRRKKAKFMKEAKKSHALDHITKLKFFQKIMTGSSDRHLKPKQVQDDFDLDTSARTNMSSQSIKLTKLSALVKKESSDLPQLSGDFTKSSARQRPRPRHKSISDGVAAMRMFSGTSAVAAKALQGEDTPLPGKTTLPMSSRENVKGQDGKKRQKRQKSASTGVLLMKSPTGHEGAGGRERKDYINQNERLTKLSEFVKKDAKDLPDLKYGIESRQRTRHKSISDGVAAMRMVSGTPENLQNDLERDKSQMEREVPATESRRSRRQKSVSTGVFLMQSELSAPITDVETAAQTGDDRSSSSSTTAQEPCFSLAPKMFCPPHKTQLKEEIPMSLQKKKFITPIAEDGESDEEEASLESDGSVSSERSIHSSGIPDIIDFECEETNAKFDLMESVRGLYVNKKYRQASAVFGTMIAFFMIAVRIELILLDTCAIEDNQNTWDFVSRPATFWIVVVWFLGFIVEGATQAIVYKDVDESSFMVVAGMLDVILAVSCLAIFLRAEVKRCCECEGKTTLSVYRFLAESYDSNYDTCDIYHHCCPAFGHRLCGGVGSLEPWCALIACRLLRFSVAKKLTCRCKSSHLSELDNAIEKKRLEEKTINNHDIQKLDFKNEKGTIAELWAAAIVKYPDIVKDHGMFSGLLLEAMLGIESIPKQTLTRDHNDSSRRISFAPDVCTDSIITPSSMRKHSFVERQISISESSIGGKINDDNEYNFVRPAAALVRSMRRCQCKWLPLLDNWEEVDLVMTKFEIVWLSPKPIIGLWDDQIDSKVLELKKRLRQQKGGKGISLSDVVVGREVLGRLPISDITEIKVVRMPPGTKHILTKKEKKSDIEKAEARSNDFHCEFWTGDNESKPKFIPITNDRWGKVMEDDLVLHSPQGTLCVRFLVDLLAEERKEKRLTNPYIFDTNEGSLLWCQTISHLCGTQQLKQTLPNFGKESKVELIDFVEIGDPKTLSKRKSMKRNLRKR